MTLTTFFFFSGVVFSYLFIMPFAFDYNLSFSRLSGPQKLLPDITLEDYLSTFTTLTLLVGATFVTPIVLGFLSYIELLSYQTLRRGWRWSTVAAFLIAAIITPPLSKTANPSSMVSIESHSLRSAIWNRDVAVSSSTFTSHILRHNPRFLSSPGSSFADFAASAHFPLHHRKRFFSGGTTMKSCS